MSVFADNQVPAQPVLHAIEQALESPDFVGDLTMQSEKVKRYFPFLLFMLSAEAAFLFLLDACSH
jgi:hypothetical protein